MTHGKLPWVFFSHCVNIRTVQKLESGEQDIMSVSLGLGLRIADFLGVPPRELV